MSSTNSVHVVNEATVPSGMAAGTEQMVRGLRGFVTWMHPEVTVAEIEKGSKSPVYRV